MTFHVIIEDDTLDSKGVIDHRGTAAHDLLSGSMMKKVPDSLMVKRNRGGICWCLDVYVKPNIRRIRFDRQAGLQSKIKNSKSFTELWLA